MNQTISEEFIEKTKHWPINLSISQVPLDQLCFVECYELLFISRLFKTESSKDGFRSSQDLSEEETFKTITSKMRLPLRFQANLGLINLFNQDFIKTLYITRLLFYSRSRNQITIPLELTKKQTKVIALKNKSRLKISLRTPNTEDK